MYLVFSVFTSRPTSIKFFWAVISCSLVNVTKLMKEAVPSILRVKDGVRRFLRRVGSDLPDYMASHDGGK
jgi:hypothetical protein